MKEKFDLNPNPLVQYLKKEPKDFTAEDIISYIKDNEIEMLNFHYIGGDGRIKTLNLLLLEKNN